MKNIVFTILLVVPFSVLAGILNIKCVEPTSTVEVKNASNTIVATYTGANTHTFNYTDAPAVTYRVRMTYTNNEYIEKPFKLEAGTHNFCMSLANQDGFYETDRQKLDSLASEIVQKIERNTGTMKEVEAWIIKAIKELQKKP
jgi:hypothetical protein